MDPYHPVILSPPRTLDSPPKMKTIYLHGHGFNFGHAYHAFVGCPYTQCVVDREPTRQVHTYDAIIFTTSKRKPTLVPYYWTARLANQLSGMLSITHCWGLHPWYLGD